MEMKYKNEKDQKIITNIDNLSRKSITKKINLVKNLTGMEFNNKRKDNKKGSVYLKKNLTYSNLYDYVYDFNVFSKKKRKLNYKKLREELLKSKHNSFISNNLNSDNFTSAMSSSMNSSNKTKKDFKYNNNIFFTPKININSYSDLRTRVTSYKTKILNIKEFPLLRNNIMMTPRNSCKTYLHFKFDIDNDKEYLNDFIDKIKIVSKEKIKKKNMENNLYFVKAINEEDINYYKIKENENNRNLFLLNKFEKNLALNLRKIEIDYNKEKFINNKLKNQENELRYDVKILKNKKEKIEKKKENLEKIKKFLISEIYGYESGKRTDTKKDSSLFLTESNENKNNNNTKNIKKKLLYSKLLNKSFKENNKKNKFMNYYFQQYTLKKIRKSSKNVIINSKEKESKNNSNTNNLIIKTNENENINDKNFERLLENEIEFNDIYTTRVDRILNKIYYLSEESKILYKYKENLLKKQNKDDKSNSYNDSLIISKEEKLIFLKKRNEDLKKELKIVKKTAISNEDLKINLEKKIYNLLIDYNKIINIPEILDINNSFTILKLGADEFNLRRKETKLIYMLKIIELLWLFLNNFKIKCLNEPKLIKKFQNISSQLEKEKNLKILKLNKQQLKQKLKEKKLNIIKRTNKVRFISYKKFDFKYIMNNKSHSTKRIINNKNDSNPYFVEWLTYN